MLELIVLLAVVALDQAAKLLCVLYLKPLPGGTYPLWENVFHLTYVENTGAAFSLLRDHRWLLILITSAAIALMVLFGLRFRKHLHKLFRISLALVVGGALGNLIDRIFLGYVRDMLHVALVDFAVFNVADSAVTVGVALIVIDVLFLKDGRRLAGKLDAWERARVRRKKGDGSEGG